MFWRRDARSRAGELDAFRRRYESFRRLLGRNGELLVLLSELEIDLRYARETEAHVVERVRRILETSLEIVQDLDDLTEGEARALFEVHARLERTIRAALDAKVAEPPPPLVVLQTDPRARSPAVAGGKAAPLARLAAALPASVPTGFVATTEAYRRLAAAVRLGERLRALAGSRGDDAAVAARAGELRAALEAVPVPAEIADAIGAAAARFPGASRWAVRSSAVGEDGPRSFAGLFDTVLGVPAEGLAEAWRRVATSRFSDRAVAYGRAGALGELETPMAVLFLPMIDARAAGVVYTRDPTDPDEARMWVSAVVGLAADLVGGTGAADLFVVAREPPGAVLERRLAVKDTALGVSERAPGLEARPIEPARRDAPALDDREIATLAALGLQVERRAGCAQDLEWAIDQDGTPWLLQARPLGLAPRRARRPAALDAARPAIRGRPLAPGRAVGPVHLAPTARELDATPVGAVLVLGEATPELGRVLDRVVGVVAERGSPTSHAATMLRQAGVPAISEVPRALASLEEGSPVGIDGSRGDLHAGVPWPELAGRPPPGAAPARREGPLHELILRLTLVDPAAASFRPDACRSIHDLLRLVHERAIGAMFQLGDRHARGRHRAAVQLESEVPLALELLDLGGGLAPEARGLARVPVAAIRSVPFLALWRGVADPRVRWSGRRVVSGEGLMSVMAASLVQVDTLRRLGDRNYVVLAADYLNLNARLAYHYALLDCVVGDLPDNNTLTFRFRGGGAGARRRDLRARFLEEVLARAGFGVDRRGDLLNAWLRGRAREPCEEALELLGRLMGCARQLDMLLGDEAAVAAYVRRFLDGDYGAFA